MAQSSLPGATTAIAPLSGALPNDSGPRELLSGTAAIDLISVRAIGPGVPLRFGHVVPQSERIQLGSRLLKRTDDYGMDYETGVVYLATPTKSGDSLTVTYRYTDSAATTTSPANSFSSLGGFKYSLRPGSLDMVLGFGQTERTADGNVLTSNVFGTHNNFKFSGGSMGGVFLYGERQKTQNSAGLSMDQNAHPGDADSQDGHSQLILQGLESKFLGGSAKLDYQDVGSSFAGFASAKNAGLDDAAVNKLKSERGLTRVGMSLTDMKVGSMLVSNGFHSVKDGSGAIDWRSYGLNSGGFKLNFNSQRIDNGFNRFHDITEVDRDQLMREKGMSRENFASEFAQKSTKLSYNQSVIKSDSDGLSIKRKETGLDISGLKVRFGEQTVSNGFTRFDSLLAQEKASYGKEASLRRQWLGLESSLIGKNTAFTLAESKLKSDHGDFNSTDVAIINPRWSLAHSERKSDKAFANLGSMADAELDGHVKSIAAMYGDGVAVRPEDRGAFVLSPGVDRSFNRFALDPIKGWKFGLSQLKLKGLNGGGEVNTFSLAAKGVDIGYRKQSLGSNFNELSSLMSFETQKLGTIVGLNRTDETANFQMAGNKSLSLSSTKGETSAGGFSRIMASLKAPNLEVSVASRKVDSAFTSTGQLVDSEKDLLGTLIGFKQQDGSFNWRVSPKLNLQASLFDSVNPTTGENRHKSDSILNWQPDGKTKFNFTRHEQKSEDPLSLLFANTDQKVSLSRSFGRYGNLDLLDETQVYDGKTATRPDAHTQSLAYETQINAKTSVRTEQSRTSFSNGEKENISANTVKTELSKHSGVSVTDTEIDRGGNTRDETKRNYGFWLDIGNGLKVSYGYNRQLVGQDVGTLNTNLTVGKDAAIVDPSKVNTVQPGQLGPVMVGGGYGVNKWDATEKGRTQAFSNVNLSTAHPLKFGIFQDIKFNFGLDTAADYAQWSRESRTMGLSAKVGKNSFGYDYVSQMNGTGLRGIDRIFRFQTDTAPTAKLTATIFYKLRTMPTNENVMVRDFSVTAKPLKDWEIINQLQTNPEVIKSDAFLGSVPQAARSNNWKINYLKSDSLTVGASWQELINEQSGAKATTGGINLELFKKSGSPLKLFYGIEQNEGNVARRLTHRYHVQFDEHAGPNQVFSLFAGNVSYEHSIADSLNRNNITVRVDYQLRF